MLIIWLLSFLTLLNNVQHKCHLDTKEKRVRDMGRFSYRDFCGRITRACLIEFCFIFCDFKLRYCVKRYIIFVGNMVQWNVIFSYLCSFYFRSMLVYDYRIELYILRRLGRVVKNMFLVQVQVRVLQSPPRPFNSNNGYI